MDVRVDNDSDLTVWTLKPGLTIYEIEELHEQAIGSLPKTRRLIINGEAVEEIDTAGLQWLLAIQRWSKEQDIDFLLELGDSSVTQLLDLYHAHGLFGLPAIIVAASQSQQEGSDADW
ncbi:MAG: hypothetical protein R3180_05350 [Marinobacter sp.]|nr:hypothetical protein [Marinobacter sp.]